MQTVFVMSGLMYPVSGLILLAAMVLLFRPLLAGIVQATIVLFVPRRSLEQRVRKHRFDGIRMLNRMANDYSRTQPNFAAELRALAARDN